MYTYTYAHIHIHTYIHIQSSGSKGRRPCACPRGRRASPPTGHDPVPCRAVARAVGKIILSPLINSSRSASKPRMTKIGSAPAGPPKSSQLRAAAETRRCVV